MTPTTPNGPVPGVNFSPYVVSLIRTVVPALIGLGLTQLARLGFTFDTTAVVGPVVVGMIGAYYALVRAVERRWPRAGWLLGVPVQPRY